VTQQGCALAGAVFTMSITADVAAIETPDALGTPEETSTLPPKCAREAQRKAGGCDFCHAPLPAFTRLRTWRGWGFG
jgi:hypothetical protein